MVPDYDIAESSTLNAVVYRSASADALGTTSDPSGVSARSFVFNGFEDECYPFNIAVSASGSNIAESECVFVDETPAMPQLSAMITSGNISGYVDWSLRITYNRSGRTDSAIYHENLSAGSSWAMGYELGDSIKGGQAVVTCTPEDTSKGSRSFAFAIRGTNPSELTIINYIENKAGAMWYDKYVAKHESAPPQAGRYYLQFNEKPLDDNHCGDASDVRFTPNASGDGGFGLFQLTYFRDTDSSRTRLPKTEELWNWKANVNSATSYFRYLDSIAEYDMAVERLQAYIHFEADPDQYPVPDDTVGSSQNVVFSDGTDRVIEHAVALKQYNGLGRAPLHNYCWFDDTERLWMFDRWARYINSSGELDSNRYVYDVCSLVP